MDTNNFGINEGFAGFAKSTTKMSASIATFVAGVDAFSTGNMEFADTLKKWGKTFSLASLVIATEKMASRYLDARIELSKTLSLAGDKRRGMLKVLQQERSGLIQYGITMSDSVEVLTGLVGQMGSIDMVSQQEGLIESTMIMAKGFHTTNEAMTELTGSMALFTGRDAASITSLMGTVSATSERASVSTNAVFENIRSASNMMYLFNLKAEGGEARFAEMSTSLTAMGMNIGSTVESLQEFRDVGAAVAKSAELSALGLTIAPTQLMQMAYDPTNIDSHMFDMFSKMEGLSSANQFALADKMAPMFSMSRDQFMKSFNIAQKTNGGISALVLGNEEAKEHFKAQSLASMAFTDRLDSLLNAVVSGFIDPVIGPLVKFLDKIFGWMAENTWAAKLITGAVLGIWAIQKTKALVGKASNIWSGTGKSMFDMGGYSDVARGPGGRFQKVGRGRKIKRFLGAWGGMGSDATSGGSVGSGSKMPKGAGGLGKAGGFGKMSSTGLLKGAAALVIMAGAVWVMGKALHQFEGLDWKTLGLAGATLLGMTAAFVVIGAVMSSGVGTVAILAGAAAIVILGVAMIPAAYAMNIFGDAAIKFGTALSSVIGAISGGVSMVIETIAGSLGQIVAPGADYFTAAAGIFALSGAIASFGAASAAGGIGSFIGNIFGGGDALQDLGKFAKEYATPLKIVGEAVQNIADGMERIAQANELSGLVAANGVQSGGRMLEAHIRIDMNGTKLAEQLDHVWAGDKK